MERARHTERSPRPESSTAEQPKVESVSGLQAFTVCHHIGARVSPLVQP